MIYRKLYMEKILSFINTPFVKILTGVRRCGKSTILVMLKEELKKKEIDEEQLLSYNFDSLQYEDIDADVYVTSSNSRMMSSEISTYLTGHYVSFRIYPLSFGEYLDFRWRYAQPADLYVEFKRYIRMGGFRALQWEKYTYEQAYTVIKDIYQTFSVLMLSRYLKSQNSGIVKREETENHEYGNLLPIVDNYSKYVLRMDEMAGGNYEGIRTMHVAYFLLDG